MLDLVLVKVERDELSHTRSQEERSTVRGGIATVLSHIMNKVHSTFWRHLDSKSRVI